MRLDDEQAAPMGQGTPVSDKKGGGLGRITGSFIDERLFWGDLGWLRKHWKGKVVLKGIMGADDAKMAVEHKVDGIVLRYVTMCTLRCSFQPFNPSPYPLFRPRTGLFVHCHRSFSSPFPSIPQ